MQFIIFLDSFSSFFFFKRFFLICQWGERILSSAVIRFVNISADTSGVPVIFFPYPDKKLLSLNFLHSKQPWSLTCVTLFHLLSPNQLIKYSIDSVAFSQHCTTHNGHFKKGIKISAGEPQMLTFSFSALLFSTCAITFNEVYLN